MSQMQIIMERWRHQMLEQERFVDVTAAVTSGAGAKMPKKVCMELREPEHIITIGQLHTYFAKKDPGELRKLAARFGGLTAKAMGIAAGTAAGAVAGPAGAAVGTAVSTIAGEVVQQMLQASIMAFANMEDGTYEDGTAGTYFDLDDKLTMFLRHLETGGKEITKPSKPEQEVFAHMKKKIEAAVTGDYDPCMTIAELLKDVTAQSVLDAKLKGGEFSGAVTVTPVGE